MTQTYEQRRVKAEQLGHEIADLEANLVPGVERAELLEEITRKRSEMIGLLSRRPD